MFEKQFEFHWLFIRLNLKLLVTLACVMNIKIGANLCEEKAFESSESERERTKKLLGNLT